MQASPCRAADCFTWLTWLSRCSTRDSKPNWRRVREQRSLHLPRRVPLSRGLVLGGQVVMYDASGVRLHAGKQASVLNMIICELPPDHPVSDTRPLRDTLGHTPLQARLASTCRHSSFPDTSHEMGTVIAQRILLARPDERG